MPRLAKGPRLWFDDSLGLWYVRDGTKKRGTGCGLAERQRAETALQAYIAEKYEPVSSSNPAAITVKDVLTFYTREIAPDHRSPTAGYAADRLLEFWAHRPLTDIKTSTCREYITHRTSQPRAQAKTAAAKVKRISRATAGRELTVLRAALRAYHAENGLTALPIVTVPEAAPSRDRWLTRLEFAKMLRAARALRDKAAGQAIIRFLLVAVYTGTRSGAIRTLGWLPNTEGGWIDLDAGVMHRRSSEDVETKKRKPPIKIPPSLLTRMRRWREADGTIAWMVHDQGRLLASQRKSWAAIRTAAGLGAEVTPHILRHTAATWLLQSRADPTEAANFLGMSLEMLMGVYGHHHPDFQDDVAGKAGRGRKRSKTIVSVRQSV